MVAFRDLVGLIAVPARAVIASTPGRDSGDAFGRCPSPTWGVEGETRRHDLEVLVEVGSCARRRPLSLPPSCLSRPSCAGAAAGGVGQWTWRECGVRPVTLRGMSPGNEGRSRVSRVCVQRPQPRCRGGPGAPVTSATGETTSYPGAQPVANSRAHPMAKPSPGGASPLVPAEQMACGVAG